MRKYLTDYLNHLEMLLKEGKDLNLDELMEEHLHKIQFMQHERLIHFLVTMLFAICFFITIGFLLIVNDILLVPLLVLILSLLIPYVMHYYFLENSVQKMYMLYDEILRRMQDAKKE